MPPAPLDKPDARSADRVMFDVAKARLRQQGARGIDVPIKDLSRTGFKAEWPHTVRIGQIFWLTLPGLSPLIARAVWTRDFEVGCRFEEPVHAEVLRRVVVPGLNADKRG